MPTQGAYGEAKAALKEITSYIQFIKRRYWINDKIFIIATKTFR